MSKPPIEMYVTYAKEPNMFGGKVVSINLSDLRQLVELAGLYIHPPDKGTGVRRINETKFRRKVEVPNG